MGALVGAIVGATGGLFALGIAPAVIDRNAALLFGTPILGLICFFVSGAVGWLIGGQLGPRLGDKFQPRSAELVGGALGGLVPVTLIALWGWYMVTPH
jgi:hypothetical protein